MIHILLLRLSDLQKSSHVSLKLASVRPGYITSCYVWRTLNVMQELLVNVWGYCYLVQLSCHSLAVGLTLVQTKQIRITLHKRNNTKNTVQTIQNTVNTSIHITKTVHILPKEYTYYQNSTHITKTAHILSKQHT